jgi:hypothetical protein
MTESEDGSSHLRLQVSKHVANRGVTLQETLMRLQRRRRAFVFIDQGIQGALRSFWAR